MRKRLVRTLIALAVGFGTGTEPARAAAPELLSYQGVLTQNNGVAVANGVYSLRFRLYSQQTAGMPLFEQTLSTQVTHGLYNVILSNHASYDLGDIVNQNPQLFMEVTVKANLGLGVPTDLTLLPRQQLASVPYSLSNTPSATMQAAAVKRATVLTVPSGGSWQTLTGLEGLSLSVPSSGCVLEVRAEVVVSATLGVGVRLEQSSGGGAYVVVRGPVVGGSSSGSTATIPLSYVLEGPPSGELIFRLAGRASTSYTVSPSVSPIGQTESSLSGSVYCP